MGVSSPPMDAVRKILGYRLNEQRTGEFPRPSDWSERDRKTVRDAVAGEANALGYEL